jgi:hypothetical protein
LVFEKKRQFFRRKLSKIAENCDHNIGPWFTRPAESRSVQIWGALRSPKKFRKNRKNKIGDEHVAIEKQFF